MISPGSLSSPDWPTREVGHTRRVGQPFPRISCVQIFQSICLLVYGSARSSLLCGLFSSCSAQASHRGGFSCFRAQALGGQASVVVARGLSSCAQGNPDVYRCGQKSGGVVLWCSLGLLDLSSPPRKKSTQNEDMKPRSEDTKLGNAAKPSRDEKWEKLLMDTLLVLPNMWTSEKLFIFVLASLSWIIVLIIKSPH